jgi:ribonuclease HI
MNLVLYVDGGSRGNPGLAGAGVVIVDAATQHPRHEAGYFVGRVTNNVAEYQGLIRGLTIAASLAPQQLTVRADSQLMVYQMTGRYRVKTPHLKPLHQQAVELSQQIGHVEFEHVYREDNKRADELANKAMDAKADVVLRSCGDDAAATDTAQLERDAEPHWKLEIRSSPGPKCPAQMKKGQQFELGVVTPSGMCVHAAAAAINECLAQTAAEGAAKGQASCPRCRATIRITPA